jgi:hypothetical protein
MFISAVVGVMGGAVSDVSLTQCADERRAQQSSVIDIAQLPTFQLADLYYLSGH